MMGSIFTGKGITTVNCWRIGNPVTTEWKGKRYYPQNFSSDCSGNSFCTGVEKSKSCRNIYGRFSRFLYNLAFNYLVWCTGYWLFMVLSFKTNAHSGNWGYERIQRLSFSYKAELYRNFNRSSSLCAHRLTGFIILIPLVAFNIVAVKQFADFLSVYNLFLLFSRFREILL